jgi:hypothetical protein
MPDVVMLYLGLTFRVTVLMPVWQLVFAAMRLIKLWPDDEVPRRILE